MGAMDLRLLFSYCRHCTKICINCPKPLKLVDMDKTINGLKKVGFKGEIDDSATALEFYSHDASMFELKPKLVVKPKDAKDVEELVKYVAANKAHDANLSITARSAGTCMSGGSINDSIIVDFQKHFNSVKKVTSTTANVEPGVFYRDFEPETLKHGALMP